MSQLQVYNTDANQSWYSVGIHAIQICGFDGLVKFTK